MTQFLSDLNAEKNQRRKLQHTYIVLAILLTFVAGVVALADPSLSRCIVTIAGGVLVVFLINGVSWAVLEAFVAPRLPKPKPTQRSTKRPRK